MSVITVYSSTVHIQYSIYLYTHMQYRYYSTYILQSVYSTQSTQHTLNTAVLDCEHRVHCTQDTKYILCVLCTQYVQSTLTRAATYSTRVYRRTHTMIVAVCSTAQKMRGAAVPAPLCLCYWPAA